MLERVALVMGIIALLVQLFGGFRFMLNEWRNWRNKSKWLVVIVLCLMPSMAEGGTVYNAASCSRADVGAAVALAMHTDTVTIPACAQTDWTTQLSITQGITLQGAGEGLTIIGDNVPKNSGIPGNQCNSTVPQLIAINVNTPNTVVMGSFTIVGVATEFAAVCNKGHLILRGTMPSFRVHHITINPTQTVGIFTYQSQNQSALIDHVTFIGSDNQGVNIHGEYWGGSYSEGDDSWSDPLVWGGANVLFIEDSYFEDTTGGQHGLTDCYGGARYVSRHNTSVNFDFAGSHGTDTSGRIRSCRQIEAYNNTASWTFSPVDRGQQTRGGTSVVYNNAVTAPGSFNSMVKATNFRDSASHGLWGKCDGSSLYDENQVGLTGYRCVDQPGAGTSNNLGGGPTPSPADTWVGNVIDPIYVWGNTLNGSSNNTVAATTHVVQNQDYYNDGTTRPGYTAYTYPHPLQSGGAAPGPVVIARVIRWMSWMGTVSATAWFGMLECLSVMLGLGFHFRRPLARLAFAGVQRGGILFRSAPTMMNQTKQCGRAVAIKALTVFNHLTKP